MPHQENQVSTSAEPQTPEEEMVRLKEPGLSAFLAWLVPGLGHLYQGRRAKAALFFVCIMGTFLYGLYLGGSSTLGWGRVVYFGLQKNYVRLPYFCQIGIGLPAMPALVQANRMASNKPVFWNGFMAPPRLPPDAEPRRLGPDINASQPTLHELHLELDRNFELGTVYTMIAGLLNILAVYDAWGGPVFHELAKKRKRKDEEPDEPERPPKPQGTAV